MIRALLSSLFSPAVATLRADRDLLRLECAALRADNAEKDRKLADASQRIQKLALVAIPAINRYEAAESQLAGLRGRIEPMALVYPWLNEEVSARSARPERKA